MQDAFDYQDLPLFSAVFSAPEKGTKLVPDSFEKNRDANYYPNDELKQEAAAARIQIEQDGVHVTNVGRISQLAD